MHVLGSIGHGFSQRRKTTPRDLHIRKVSLSGCSLASGDSFSSSSSTSTARAPNSALTTPSASSGFDPLSLHPTFQPPPRLHDRPLISPERTHYTPSSSFFPDDSSDDDSFDDRHSSADDEEYTVCRAQELHFSHPKEMVLPPHASPMDHSTDNRSEPQDYFMVRLAERPNMPRSRWSESTIQTLDQDDFDETPGTDEDIPLEMPNFSRKRNAAPSRPPLRSLDSLDDFIKKGGWKRRGVVFNKGEARQHSAEF